MIKNSLSLKLGLALNSAPSSEWSPLLESSLEGWWKYKTDVTTVADDKVSNWKDSSTNSHNMLQENDAERPIYDSSSGSITFDSSNTTHLESGSQISLSGSFTMAFWFHPTSFNNSVIGDNTTAGEFIKLTGNDEVKIKIDSSDIDLNLNSGTTWGNNYVVITRFGTRFNIWHNGVKQTDGGDLSGTADIDAIGVRKTDLNPFNGKIFDVQVYSSVSGILTTNINNYYKGIYS